MNEYIKPNVILPISLHDTRVTKVIVPDNSLESREGMLTLEFDDGLYKVALGEAYQTGKAFVELSGIDYDFSHVWYYIDNSRNEISFSKFAQDVESAKLEITDETYGYNQTRYGGHLYLEEKWIEIEIDIYHFGQTVYKWE